MILAAFGAVHGNLTALESVLADIDREGIQTIACTGDVALGPQPNAVIEILRNRRIHLVQGDSDRLLARLVRKRKRLERELDPARLAALELAHRQCTSGNVEWLAGLPHAHTFTVDGETVALFNGTIPSAAARLHADDPDELFRRQREVVPGRVFICGGTPEHFARLVDDALFASPGTLLQTESEAVYTVISTESDPPQAERRTVAVSTA